MEGLSHDNIISGVILLILAISGNYLSETFACKTQKFLHNNMLPKHMLILLIIYFSLEFTEKKNKHPIIISLNSVMIWGLFLLFTKMDPYFTAIVFIMLGAQFVMSTLKRYYIKTNEDKTKTYKIKILEKSSINLAYIIVVTIIIGFIIYLFKKYDEYHKTWSTMKFLFGTPNCKSFKNPYEYL